MGRYQDLGVWEVSRVGRYGLSAIGRVSVFREIRYDGPSTTVCMLDRGEYRRGGGAPWRQSVHPFSRNRKRITRRDRTHLILAGGLGMADEKHVEDVLACAEEVGKMLTGLKQALR